MEEQTKYKIETTDAKLARLYLNAPKLAWALSELMDWRREVYNGKDYGEGIYINDSKVLGEANDSKFLDRQSPEVKNIDWDEVRKVYTDDDLEKHFREILDPVVDAVLDYIE